MQEFVEAVFESSQGGDDNRYRLSAKKFIFQLAGTAPDIFDQFDPKTGILLNRKYTAAWKAVNNVIGSKHWNFSRKTIKELPNQSNNTLDTSKNNSSALGSKDNSSTEVDTASSDNPESEKVNTNSSAKAMVQTTLTASSPKPKEKATSNKSTRFSSNVEV